MTFAELMFYAEAEDLLPDMRSKKLKAAAAAIKKMPGDVINQSDFIKVLKKYGLNYKDLTQSELQYIEDYIAK